MAGGGIWLSDILYADRPPATGSASHPWVAVPRSQSPKGGCPLRALDEIERVLRLETSQRTSLRTGYVCPGSGGTERASQR